MSTVVSVNVGLPRDVQWQGKTVRTAIWKDPVAGRVMARRLNLDGDGHGGEHRAVMVYQLDSYRYWESQLNETGFVYGQFGENLTIDGFADSEVRIGDRFRIGGAVFEVTQPRVTCYRLGIRMNRPDMAALLVSHDRPGFYLRVIQEGEIGAGDEIVKIADGPERVSVADIDALLYLPDRPRDLLARALRIPALSPGWQGSLRSLLTAADEARQAGNAGPIPSGGTAPSWPGFRPLKVIKSTEESADVRSFVLAAADGSRLPDPRPGQYIVIKVRPESASVPLVRSYSLSGPQDAGTYRIGVKREAGGAVSEYLHQHVDAGSIVEATSPRGTFTLGGGAAPVVLLSAGIGITPVLAMLHALAGSDGGHAHPVWWVHGARDGSRNPFAEEVRKLLDRLKTATACNIYSQPTEEDRLGHRYDAQGHITHTMLMQHGVPKEADFYLCGPAEFLSELTAGLKLWGVADSGIHTEIFGPGPSLTPGVVGAEREAPHLPSGVPGAGPNVTFTRSGLTVPWSDRSTVCWSWPRPAPFP